VESGPAGAEFETSVLTRAWKTVVGKSLVYKVLCGSVKGPLLCSFRGSSFSSEVY